MKIYTNKRFEETIEYAEMNAYQAGKTAGETLAKRRLGEDIMLELQAKSLDNFSSDELRLGYSYAVDVVRAIIERSKF